MRHEKAFKSQNKSKNLAKHREIFTDNKFYNFVLIIDGGAV